MGTTAAREWKNPDKAPKSKIARLNSVRVLNADNQIAQTVDIRHPVTLEMNYDVMEADHLLLPHFRLANDRGDCIFVTVDQDSQWRGRRRPAGNYVNQVEIPGNLLAEGLVIVNCNLITLNPDSLVFTARSVVSFNVVDSMEGNSARGDFAKNMPGIVRPKLKWKTDYSKN